MRGQRKEESSQQVTHFRCGEREKRLCWPRLLSWSIGGKMTRVLHANPHKEGISQENKRDVTIPSDVTADLVLIEPEVFGGFQILLDVPPVANGPNHL